MFGFAKVTTINIVQHTKQQLLTLQMVVLNTVSKCAKRYSVCSLQAFLADT